MTRNTCLTWLSLALVALFPARSLALGDEAPWLTGASRPEDLSIFLVTFSPGDDIPSYFGHGALGVQDNRLGDARLYNYGMFSFDEKMLVRFVMGRLLFWVAETPVKATYRFYKSLDRSVRIQTLALDPERAAQMAKALALNVQPQNREYLYHHYRDNCSTRLRDAIDKAVGGQFHATLAGPARMTLRNHTRRFTHVGPVVSMVLDYWMNDEIDQPITRWDESFLPDELEAQVAAFSYKNAQGQEVPLVAKHEVWASTTRSPAPATVPVYGPWALALGVFLGGIAFALGQLGGGLASRRQRIGLGLYNALLGLVFGLPAIALTLMWTFTEHTVTWRNENLFLANPLTFLALPLGIALAAGSPRAERWLRWVWCALALTGALSLVVKLLPMFDQDNWRLIGLLWPCSLGMAAAFLRRR
jgi:hypothetical protein